MMTFAISISTDNNVFENFPYLLLLLACHYLFLHFISAQVHTKATASMHHAHVRY